MHAENSGNKGLKQKAIREFKEALLLTGYLAFFFCALATYSMLLLGRLGISYFAYGTALINALVIAKVILIGEALRAGKKYEGHGLLYSALWKSFVFGCLVFGFRILEEMIKELVHGQHALRAFHELRLDEMMIRTVIIICTFIPLFVFRELRRVMGEDNFWDLVLHSRENRATQGKAANS